MTYVRWPSPRGSWHVIKFYDRGGAARTRCGRRARVEGTIAAGPNGPTKVSPTADVLPTNERTCERCLALSIRDADPPEPSNDEVPV